MDVGPDTRPVGVPAQHSRAASQRTGAAARGPFPRPESASEDPLRHADPYTAADAAATENLVRCWIRETAAPRPQDGVLHIALTVSGTALHAPVRHWSATGHHRFGRVHLDGGAAADAVTVAALLSREAAAGAALPLAQEDGADLVGRVADSVRRTARFISGRRADPAPDPAADAFLDAEQALVLGHPLHPTPKSREGLAEADAAAYSPELRGSFPLHWYAVATEALASDSAWTRAGRAVPAEALTRELAGAALVLPPGTAALPLHPWQAAHLARQPRVRELTAAGLLHDLGPAGDSWYPTSSVRTVHRPGGPAMLKLSLALRITNSRRENLHKEHLRGVEVHRLLRTGLAERWHAEHPGFDIVRDPAWLAVNAPGSGEGPLPGFDVIIRHNPFGPGDDPACVAGLTAERPWPGEPPTELRSRLARTVTAIADRTGRPTGAVAAEWFLRYLDAVVRPILWLDGEAGVALEAHQQNTLVLLDADGWPAGGRYRDNQGYYFRESHREELDRRLPGIGTASDTFVSDAVADERFAYYLAINNILGLVGAFGSQRLADEQVLLAALRRFLAGAASTGRSTLPARLLDAPTLRCKANLLTRLHGMDELVGPVDTQSVYVTIANPVVDPSASTATATDRAAAAPKA